MGNDKCDVCNGTGNLACHTCQGSRICSLCKGKGKLPTYGDGLGGGGEIDCGQCKGTGKCPTCNGINQVSWHICGGTGLKRLEKFVGFVREKVKYPATAITENVIVVKVQEKSLGTLVFTNVSPAMVLENVKSVMVVPI